MGELPSDEWIRGLTPQQRRDLVRRLQGPLPPVLSQPHVVRRRRRLALAFMALATAFLIPWTIWLAVTLPSDYQAHNWPATWVGFDFGLVAMVGLTLLLGLLKRQLTVLFAFGTGILLVCDAWFDVMTSSAADRPMAIASALCAELPLAGLLVWFSTRAIRVAAERMGVLLPEEHLWDVRAAMADALDEPPATP